MTEETQKRDYRDTVFLPKTDFPMKAGLPQKEPGIEARWREIGLYEKLREARRGREKFILHDGPPYANGDMHIGHALNHILKDMVCRTQNLLGKDAPYVPGWDCHGLPIEWKVEEQYRKKKKNKDEVPAKEFRAECRAYAQHWVDTQREQLKRLGIMGDWDNPYLTMDFQAEATIVAELLKFAEAGNLYRGSKPVMWSPVEKTALAEAEVEYEDLTDSPQVDVAFEIVESPIEELVGAHAVIWTTTPWTIPVNQALAYGPDVEYVLAESGTGFSGFDGDGGRNFDFTSDEVIDKSTKHGLTEEAWEYLNDANEKIEPAMMATGFSSLPKVVLIARDLVEALNARVANSVRQIDWSEHGLKGVVIDFTFDETRLIKGSDLAGTKVRHPMHHLGGFYATPRPFLAGDFVTTESGTGLVHMSPDHGEDDFDLCKANDIHPVFAVMDDGRYRDDWEWLGGSDERRRSVINKPFNAPDGPICSDLREAGALLSASADYAHSYPHSWRSKAKVIFRCTPQWFVPMDKELEPVAKPSSLHSASIEEIEAAAAGNDALQQAEGKRDTLRTRAMSEIGRVRFVPEKGRNRIGSMVEGRPDWVLSRQRAWGVPITLFVRPDGSYLQDPAVNARIVAAVQKDGVDAWEEARKAEFLGNAHNPDDFEMVMDILDVWFDSGCTHAFVLESGRWPDLQWPADLYLEGSDQHRGWFQSSLLQSCATRGRAPYDQVLTHGFTMDAKGKKMSKSLGNTVDPLKIMETTGADIIRLWALSVDFTEDHRIGDEILKGVGDQYRRLRNTFRYLLGALDGFVGDMSDAGEIPELEVYVLSLLSELDGKLRQAVEDYDYNTYTRLLVDFCNEDLSAFFFDIRKDTLYCDGGDSAGRNAYRTVLDLLFHALVRWAAPVLVFTSEEVWNSRYPEDDMPDEDGQVGSVHLLEWPSVPAVTVDRAKWDKLRALRERVTEAIEPLRRDKVIRSSNEATVTVPAGAVPEGVTDAQLAELFITGTVTRGDGDEVIVAKSTDAKCGRCWRLLPDVPEDGALCGRCDSVVSALDEVAA
ncbi:isoleucine--tRNA ligase [Erythrobacter sp. JK5]|uniref:isoleucine--tRNA ligase n=1 Tax=Erythrobacter sp. JK5 TaxID=2829500 RepID=UPI001BAAE998|nr:isoleucine--tRNA ligase [Erythrobacter sp. JK5]QUL37379.1 isoleucine--tRNA ligase [Erythrobacter sp. JK5]